MRTRALQALLTAVLLHGVAPAVAQLPLRNYVPRLYRSVLEREAVVGHDARRLGMGSVGIAGGASPDAVAWNPAGLAGIDHTAVGVMDSASADTSVSRGGAASAAVPLADLNSDAPGAVGGSAWIGDWGPEADKQRSFLVGYGVATGPASTGVALRHERHYFGADTLSAWTVDVGIEASGAAARGHTWRAGLVGSRLGQALRDQRGLRAPRAFNPARVGAGGQYSLGDGPTLATELSYVGDTRRDARDRIRWRVGVEQLLLSGRLGVRAGYNSIANYDRISHGLASVGVSAYVAGAGIDYAFVTGSNGLGEPFPSRHYVSFQVAWDGVELAAGDHSKDGGFTLPRSAAAAPVSVRHGAFSPNGDGVRDAFVLDVGVDEPGATVILTAPDGSRVRAIPVSDRMEATWDGRATDGSPAADGLYRWDVVIGDRVLRSGLALLDASPPAVRLAPSPIVFTAGREQPHGAVLVSVEEANAVQRWSLSVTHDDRVISALEGAADVPQRLAASDMEGLRAGGAYRLTVRVVDEAGSETVESAEFTVINLRTHTAWVEDDVVYVDAPSTYFGTGNADLSREARDLVALASQDKALHVGITHGADDLAADRSEAVRAALIAEGMPADHVRTRAPASQDETTGSGIRLALSSRPREGASGTTPAAGAGHHTAAFRVLIGSFRDKANAELAASDLSQSGISGTDVRVREVELASGTWFRVVVGAFDTRAEAEDLRAEARAHVAGDPIVLTPAIP